MRVMTWNIHGVRDASLADLGAQIAAVAPDVACLQEVPRRLGARLGAAAGMRAYVASSPIGPYGNAILTAAPVRAFRRLRFRRVRRTDRRDAAIVTLEDGTEVAGVHLSLRSPDRARHVAELLGALAGRAIVAGDMNERPGGTVWSALDARLHDAAAAASSSASAFGAPASPDASPTFPAAAPTARIDGIWVPRGATVLRCDVLPTASSDHRPVVADVELS